MRSKSFRFNPLTPAKIVFGADRGLLFPAQRQLGVAGHDFWLGSGSVIPAG